MAAPTVVLVLNSARASLISVRHKVAVTVVDVYLYGAVRLGERIALARRRLVPLAARVVACVCGVPFPGYVGSLHCGSEEKHGGWEEGLEMHAVEAGRSWVG